MTTVEAHGLTHSWNAQSATWMSDGTRAWVSPGGDFDPNVYYSATIEANAGVVSWYPRWLVQQWVDQVTPNYGFLLKQDTETVNNVLAFTSADAPDSPQHPRPLLSVTYTATLVGGSFIVECGFVKRLPDDPIVYPNQPGASHSHDFFGNDRTNAYSTMESEENATVALASATENASKVSTFTVEAGSTHSFTIGQQVMIEGVILGGSTENGYNGLWTVSQVPNSSTFKASISASGLGTATGGTAGDGGDQGLSCGDPHGNLTYDTAAYWLPSIYIGPNPVQPDRVRIYYFGPGDNLPEGLQVIGGNKSATSPSANPHVLWTCGHTKGFDSPNTRHPYDCTRFQRLAGNHVVDGPVAIVVMPNCYTGQGVGPAATVYPESDGGSDPDKCEANSAFPHKLIKLSIRLHLGPSLMDPCGGCLAYNLNSLSETCSTTCTGAFGVADLPNQFSVNQRVEVIGAPDPNWNSTYVITSVTSTSFTVSGLPQGLKSCSATSGNCGTVAGADYTENFTIAGGMGPPDKTHPFYTIHADFWNTWQRHALLKLENDCANGSSCSSNALANINDNYQGDSLR